MVSISPDHLHFIPLGGSEQFGVNLNVYAYDGKYLAVDCGLGFADERFPGIDLILPDPEFLEERRKDLAGMIITHAHEDHIGAVAYLWPRLKCPIYCSQFTAAVLKNKFAEHGIKKAPIHVIKPHQTLPLTPFEIRFVPVTHSIPEMMCLFISCAAGTVVHSGDWNLDPTPVIGTATDPKVFQEAGKKGILAYIGDSTNAQFDGRTESEVKVEQDLGTLFSQQKGRILVTIFASNVSRIQTVLRAAAASGRQVAIAGRSLHRMTAAAKECGYLKNAPDFISEDDLAFVPAEKTVLLVTGSQGEARAALARIARGQHNFKITKGDTVIFSARTIPGNDAAINNVKNNLVAAGVKVIDPESTDYTIHVSGHPKRGEITDMLQWLKPEIVVPVHGERVMLEAHARLAETLQVPHVFVPTNGAVVRLSKTAPGIVDHVETGLLVVEPRRIMMTNHQALSERRKLQQTGTAHVSLVIDYDGHLLSAPQITTFGLFDPEDTEEQDFGNSITEETVDFIEGLKPADRRDDTILAEKVRIALRNYINHYLGLKPVTSVHITRL
ncbi:MAG: ribonuclease J [Rhodospirillales bacterium]|nr:ribonuclease J [Rhodospirillales bacterium]MCB9979543.1 ribonuclease J [Rhodospirillales bacterium]